MRILFWGGFSFLNIFKYLFAPFFKYTLIPRYTRYSNNLNLKKNEPKGLVVPVWNTIVSCIIIYLFFRLVNKKNWPRGWECPEKNPAYERHQLSWPMRIVGPIQIWRGSVIYLFKKNPAYGRQSISRPMRIRGLQRLLQTLVSKHFQALSVQNPPRRMPSILSPVVETHWWTKQRCTAWDWMDGCSVSNYAVPKNCK